MEVKEESYTSKALKELKKTRPLCRALLVWYRCEEKSDQEDMEPQLIKLLEEFDK